MVNASKPVIFVAISLLIVMLICSPRFPVLAEAPRDICKSVIADSASKCNCTYYTHPPATRCCTTTLDGDRLCKICSVDDKGDYYDCEIFRKSPTTGQTNVPQGGGAIEQPLTPKKHGGTVLSKGGSVLENPSTEQGTNSKKGNDNSPTPPACPNKGPIPPNCTLKPKF
jgi:hypothetical protein